MELYDCVVLLTQRIEPAAQGIHAHAPGKANPMGRPANERQPAIIGDAVGNDAVRQRVIFKFAVGAIEKFPRGVDQNLRRALVGGKVLRHGGNGLYGLR